ncbi:hypothetical protein HZA43_03155 [Candidatus Peregrinibacteria bacterium]|nr:hypothetical protein [Candidatus Peregrinibacteria bacterium]
MKQSKLFFFKLFISFFFFVSLVGCGKSSPPPVIQQAIPSVSSVQEAPPPAEISSKPDKNGFLIYTNRTLGIQINFPQEWNIKNMIGSSMPFFFSPESSYADPANLNILVKIVPPDASMTLGSFTQQSIDEMKKTLVDFKLIDSRATDLDGLLAHQVVYTGTSGPSHGQFLQIWALKNGKIYLLSFVGSVASYGKFVKTAQQMIETFKIL